MSGSEARSSTRVPKSCRGDEQQRFWAQLYRRLRRQRRRWLRRGANQDSQWISRRQTDRQRDPVAGHPKASLTSLKATAKPSSPSLLPGGGDIPVPSQCGGDTEICCGQMCKVKLDYRSLKFDLSRPPDGADAAREDQNVAEPMKVKAKSNSARSGHGRLQAGARHGPQRQAGRRCDDGRRNQRQRHNQSSPASTSTTRASTSSTSTAVTSTSAAASAATFLIGSGGRSSARSKTSSSDNWRRRSIR